MSEEYLLGAAELKQRLVRMASLIPGEVSKALYAEAQIEMTEAKRRTPVDTGALRASGEVSKPVVSGREISVLLQFGGSAAGYAIYVHENLEAVHPVGQAKYLESVLLESAPFMAERVGRRIELSRLG
jgi:hypothetical protein